jgi:hypothetical protein
MTKAQVLARIMAAKDIYRALPAQHRRAVWKRFVQGQVGIVLGPIMSNPGVLKDDPAREMDLQVANYLDGLYQQVADGADQAVLDVANVLDDFYERTRPYVEGAFWLFLLLSVGVPLLAAYVGRKR